MEAIVILIIVVGLPVTLAELDIKEDVAAKMRLVAQWIT